MRILVVWAESLTKHGAGATHAEGLLRALARAGHTVTTLSPVYGQAQIRCQGVAVTPVRLPAKSWLSFGWMQALTVLCLPIWIARYRPQAIYVRSCFLQGLMALIARLWDIPLIGEVDSMVDQEILQRGQPGWMAWLSRALDTVNFRLASGLVCVTRGLRDEAVRRGASSASTVAIPNGAMTEVMQPTDRLEARRRFGLPAEGVIFGFPGTLAPWQGLDLLIEAVRIVRDENLGEFHVAFLGAGSMEDQARQWIRREGLEAWFGFHPPVPYHEVAAFLSGCDAVVIPIHEPGKLRFGLSCLKFWDAVSVGLPVVVPAGSEMEEVLADLGLPGPFTAPDARSLASVMADLAGRIERYRPRRREVHQRVARSYSWSAVARRVAEFLDQLRRRGERT